MSFPLNYQKQNSATSKKLNIVIEIEGFPFYFSLIETYKKLRYGDPGITYGAGYIYGELIPLDNVYPYLDPNTSMTISQKIEPEQGRGSASTLSFDFVDVNGFMTNCLTPGQVVDEVMGGKMVKVWIGYQNTSFREDYFVVYRGYITQIIASPTKIKIQTTDAFYQMKQQVFLMPSTAITPMQSTFNPGDVDTGTSTINLAGNNFHNGMVVNFYNVVALPGGITGVTDYYIIDYTPTSFKISASYNGSYVSLTSGGTSTTTVALKDIGPDSTYIPVDKTDGLTNRITGPNGSVDTGLKTYLRIEDEFMEYQQNGFDASSITVTRGQLGTTAIGHATTTTVDNNIVITENVLLASLKIMLSGWAGNWSTNNILRSINDTGDASLNIQPNCLVLPDSVDAVEDYGLAEGDYLTIHGSASNDGTYTVAALAAARGYPNNLIYVNKVGGGNTVTETSTSGQFDIRSQYDVYPTNCGIQLRTTDVDVAKYQYNYFTFASESDNTFQLLVKDPQSGKDLIEKEFLLPSGGYGITRFGRISCAYTRPPIASETLPILNTSTIIDPQTITITRALNQRRFWPEIQYFFDYSFLTDAYQTLDDQLDTTSLSTFKTPQVLPIQARGLRTALGAETFIARNARYLLNRYKNVAQEIKIKTNWQTASLVQVGDPIALYDNGQLKLSNFQSGARDLGFQLYEIIDWNLDMKSGTAQLTLLSNLGYQITDRFASIAPSSIVGVGSTASSVKIVDSYGALYPNNESNKWAPLVGDKIAVHSPDYSYYEETYLNAVSDSDPHLLILNPPLSGAPTAGMIVDCASYPLTTVQSDQARTKLLFVSLDPSLTVVSGVSTTQFTVSSGDAAQLNVGLPVLIRNTDWSILSAEVNVLSVVGTTVTLSTAIAFTPASGQIIELVGFKDLLGSFRLL